MLPRPVRNVMNVASEASVLASVTTTRHRLRGLYVITPDGLSTEHLLTRVRAAVAGGAAFVQYRNKSADKRLARDQAQALTAIVRPAQLIINDDLALALEVDADGLHLGATDGDLAAARRQLGPHKLLGASAYNQVGLAQAAVAAGADYVAFGSVYASTTKPHAVRAPLALFAQARGALAVPLCAIGGITHANARATVAAGADMIAVLSAVFDAPDVAAAASEFAKEFSS